MLSLSIIFASSSEAFAQVQPKAPQITLTKSVDKTVVLSGTQVTYTYTAQNTGTVPLICFGAGTGLVDSVLGPIPIGSTVLLVGQTKVFTKSATITSTTSNTATLTCKTDAGQLVATTSNLVTVTVVTPSVTIQKSVTKTKVVVGQQVTYSYKVTNTGNVNVQNCQVNDSVLGNIGAPFNLAQGAMNTVMTTVPINNDVTNTATVVCDVPTTMPSTTNALSNQVTVMIVNPAVTITKSVSKTKVIQGQQVTYTYDVTNTGDIALANCNIVDNVLGPVGAANFALGIGASSMQTAMTTINAQVTNDATVTCNEPESMNDVMATSNEVTVMIVSPSVIIEKSVDQTEVSPGTLVTYSFKVTNNGDVDVEDCQVNDNVLGNIGAPFNLAQGAMNTVTEQAAIFNEITNVATVTCNEPQSMNPVNAMSNEVTVTIILESSVDLIKTASPNPVEAGETVTYTYDVTNTGQTDLSMCNIVDDKLGAVGDADFSLVIGQSKTFFASTEIFVDTKNTAQVVCLDPENNPVGDTAMAQVIVLVVGGSNLHIDTAALLIAGISTNAAYLVPAIAGLAGIGVYLIKFRTREE